MGREPDADTPRAETPFGDRPRPPDGSGEPEPGTRRERLEPDEARRVAREQGRLIASGRARKGRIVLRTPARRAIFIAGLIGAVALALGLAALA